MRFKQFLNEKKILTFDDYSNQKGVPSMPPSFPEYHKKPGKTSKRAEKEAEKRIRDGLQKWQEQREQLYKEYLDKIEQGEIRPPSSEEKLQDIAKGSGKQAEAAKRVLKKREKRRMEKIIKQQID